MTDRRLIVIRHAKAEPYASTDHVRELTERGHVAAADLGRHLREQGLVPDHAVVSTSTRTRQTWADLALDNVSVAFEDAVFTGSPDVVVDCLRAVPEDASTVLFLGHNPTASYLCHFLDDGGGDPAAVSELLRGFPPAALCVLDVAVAWPDLAGETCRVTGFYVGRS